MGHKHGMSSSCIMNMGIKIRVSIVYSESNKLNLKVDYFLCECTGLGYGMD